MCRKNFTKKNNPWLSFWQHQNVFSDLALEKNMAVFADRSQKLLTFQNTDRVLDFGCGPGYFARYFGHKVSSICGVDINPNYIDYCQKTYTQPSLSFHKLEEMEYTNLSILGQKTFTKCIIGSVVQYFDNQQYLHDLIEEIYSRRDNNCGITILILDLPSSNSSILKDIFWQLYFGIKYGYFIHISYALVRTAFSHYVKIRSNVGLLQLDREQFEKFLSNKGFSVKFTNQVLSLNGSREHVLIQCT